MKTRCNNENSTYYHNYGGRGIKICDEWKTYTDFENWANENGYGEGLEIDRIENDLGYSPDNCRFVGSFTQSRNRRNVPKYTKDGFTGGLSEWAERLGKNRSTLAQRLYVYKWNINKVLS